MFFWIAVLLVFNVTSLWYLSRQTEGRLPCWLLLMARKKMKSDRISGLPDPIIHHIFSFLQTRQVVQTSILSNRWRYLWKSTPYLNFNLELRHGFGLRSSEHILKRDDFMEFVNQVLILCDNAFNIHKLTLSSNMALEASHVDSFLASALRQDVEQLCLRLLISQPLELPENLFTSKITTLKFIDSANNPRARMPQSMCSAAMVKVLELACVKLPYGNVDGELILSCPVLEVFKIQDCDQSHLKSLIISATRLKKYELFSTSFKLIGSCAIDIRSPDLTSLDLRGIMYNECSFVNFYALDRAYIGTFRNPVIEDRQVEDRCLIKILKGINNVRALTLSNSVPKHLGLILSERREDPESDLSIHCNFNRLETVRVYAYCGLKEDYKFLEFLLEKASLLNEIIIDVTTENETVLTKFRERILTLPRASSSVTLRCQSSRNGRLEKTSIIQIPPH